MRIISGSLKGKNINFLKSSKTRPLKDSTKENIFNILAHSNILKINLEQSRILDLYSGFGSFGLECISRGASSVTFVEKEPEVVRILKDNLINLEVQNSAYIENDNIHNFLKRKQGKKFDIIFIDPPFAESDYTKELKLIKKKRIFNNKHLVIIHRERNSNEILSSVLDILTIKEYGRSKIIFAKFLT